MSRSLTPTASRLVGPNEGEMAESGEAGIGRMAEPLEIVAAIEGLFAKPTLARALAGKHVLVTSGPTHEPIDPVRYIANRSSGKQGHAIAAAAVSAGADVTLISGPGASAGSGRRAHDQGRDRARDAGCGREGHCLPTSRSLRPRSPTGASPSPPSRKPRKTKRASRNSRSRKIPTSSRRSRGAMPSVRVS